MSSQTNDFKCVTCGAVSTDVDSFAKHNLIHDSGKKQEIDQGALKPVVDASVPQVVSPTPQA